MMNVKKSQVLFVLVCCVTALLQGVDAKKNTSSKTQPPAADSKPISSKAPKASSSNSKSTKKSKSTKGGGKKSVAPVISPTRSPVDSGGTAPPVETLSPTKNMGLMPVSPVPTKAPTQTIPVTPAPIPLIPAPAPLPTKAPTQTIPAAPAPAPTPTPPTGDTVVYLNNTAGFQAAAGGPFTSGQCEDFSKYNPSIDVAPGDEGFEECASPLSSANKCPYDVAFSARADTGDGYISILPGFAITFPDTLSYYIITTADNFTAPPFAIAGNGNFPDEPIVAFSVPVRKALVKLYYEDDSFPPPGSTGARLVVYGAGDIVLASQNLLVNGQPIVTGQTLEIGIIATQNIVRFQIEDYGGEAFFQLCFRA